eukprot:scaffold22722_cov101-Isochrysis_galbana.AAC.1
MSPIPSVGAKWEAGPTRLARPAACALTPAVSLRTRHAIRAPCLKASLHTSLPLPLFRPPTPSQAASPSSLKASPSP